jgi:hypothetical protein
MRLTTRIERLEARVPKGKKRVILVWIGADGKTTKVADTNPECPDHRHYDSVLSGYQRDGVNLAAS